VLQALTNDGGEKTVAHHTRDDLDATGGRDGSHELRTQDLRQGEARRDAVGAIRMPTFNVEPNETKTGLPNRLHL
jgi:hypothetical protein